MYRERKRARYTENRTQLEEEVSYMSRKGSELDIQKRKRTRYIKQFFIQIYRKRKRKKKNPVTLLNILT